MNFRFSPGNVVAATGVFVAVVGGTVIYRRFAYQALDGIPGEFSDVQQFVIDMPLWLPIAAIVVGLLVAFVGYAMQAGADDEHFALMAEYAEVNGWALEHTPRWAWESRTFPLDDSSAMALSQAWTGPYRGHWAASLLADNLTGAQGAESVGSFQVVGLAFNDDMPRVQVMPIDRVEKARMMVGATEIAFESADFNEAWRVQGEDAKRVHDIVHPRTMERLLKQDARGVPVVIDGGAIWTWRAEPVVGEELEKLLNVLVDMATAIPPFVYKDLNVELLKHSSDSMHADWVTSRRAMGIAVKDEFDRIADPE